MATVTSFPLTTTNSITAAGGDTSRSLSDRFADVANALDYGAVNGGSIDATAAFVAAAGTGRRVYVPAGTYLIEDLEVPNGTVLEGDSRGGTTIIATGAKGIHWVDGDLGDSSGLLNMTVIWRGTSGTCLHFDFDQTGSIRQTGFMRNVRLVGETAGTDECDKWVHVTNAKFFVADHVRLTGDFNLQADPSGQTQSIGFYADGTGFGVNISNSYLDFLWRGVWIDDGVEGFTTNGCEMIVYEGIQAGPTTKPGGWVLNTHINAVNCCIRMSGRNYARILGGSLFRASTFWTVSSWRAIELVTCQSINIDDIEIVYSPASHSNECHGVYATDTSALNICNLYALETGVGGGGVFTFANVDQTNIANITMVACDNPITADADCSDISVSNWQRTAGAWVGWVNVPDSSDIRIDRAQWNQVLRPTAGTTELMLSLKDDANTGLDSGGADRLDLITGGSRRQIWFANGNVAIGGGDSTRKLNIGVDDASNSTVTVVNRMTHTTTGTAETGIGAGDEFVVEMSDGSTKVAANRLAASTDLTLGSESFDYVINLLRSGSLTEAARFLGSGGVRLPNDGLHVRDTNASHDLVIRPGSDLTENRDFTLTTGDAARTLDISAADVTISSYIAGLLNTTTVAALCKAIGVWRVFASSFVLKSHTGDTAEHVFDTVTLPALGANSLIRVYTGWSWTNSANNKTPRVRLGGTSGTQFLNLTTATGQSFVHLAQIGNANSASSQLGSSAGAATSFTAASTALTTSSVDLSSAQDLVLSGQLANSGETISRAWYVVEVLDKD